MMTKLFELAYAAVAVDTTLTTNATLTPARLARCQENLRMLMRYTKPLRD